MGGGDRKGFHPFPYLVRFRNLAESGFDEVDHFLMLEIPCRTDDDPVRLIMGSKKLVDLISPEGLDPFRGSTDRKAKGGISPGGPIKKIVNIIIGSILHHLGLLEDAHPFLLHILFIHEGMKKDIGEEVDGKR